jgi:hypothetical protein
MSNAKYDKFNIENIIKRAHRGNFPVESIEIDWKTLTEVFPHPSNIEDVVKQEVALPCIKIVYKITE